jgi:hypothetical protein
MKDDFEIKINEIICGLENTIHNITKYLPIFDIIFNIVANLRTNFNN